MTDTAQNTRKKLLSLLVFVVALGLATALAILLFTKPQLVQSINTETQKMTAAGKFYGAKGISFSRYPGIMNVTIDGKTLQCSSSPTRSSPPRNPLSAPMGSC